MDRYYYGMKMRGFSLGCQPKDGFVERLDDRHGDYYDIIAYDRPLTDREIEDYELEPIRDKIQSGEPLDISELISITGRDALHTIGGHKVRIMNFSAGQLIGVDEVVWQDGHLWGLYKVSTPNKAGYDYIAFIAVM